MLDSAVSVLSHTGDEVVSIISILLSGVGIGQGFTYYGENQRAILSRRFLWESARLALIEPMLMKKPRNR